MPHTQVSEALTGTVDGANKDFTTSQMIEWGTLHVFVDMVEVTVASYIGNAVTLTDAPGVGTQVFAVYFVKPDEATALDLISDALNEINALAPGEEPAIEDAQMALRYLNRLIESSRISETAIYTVSMDLITLTPNKQDYTWGIDPAGVTLADINLVRPTKIRNIVLRLQNSPNIIKQPPMLELTDDDWARKRITSVTAIPLEYYNDGNYPLSTLYFFPIPSAAYQVELWTWKQATKIADLTDPIAFPPGYEDYWLYNLALRLCGPFGAQFSTTQMLTLQKANDKIASINTQAPRVATDPALSRPRYSRGSWADGYGMGG